MYTGLSRLLLVLIIVMIPTVGSGQTDVVHDLKLAMLQLTDVSIRSDTQGLKDVKARFESLVKHEQIAATAYYGLAFTKLQLTSMSMGDVDARKQNLQEALEFIDKATNLKPDYPEAYALGYFCYQRLMQVDSAQQAEYMAGMQTMHEKGLKYGPENPRTILLDSFHIMITSQGKKTEDATVRMEEAMQLFEAEQTQEGYYPDWWLAIGYSIMGQVYLAQASPDIDKARSIFKKALKIRPDYFNMRNTLLPKTVPVLAYSSERFTETRWHAILNDEEGDGRLPELADGKALAYAYDAATDTVWFKFDLYNDLNPKAFGVNLIVDTDQDQETGFKWWGTDATFTYDILVTVWVTQQKPGQFYGTIGVSEAERVQRQNFFSIKNNNIAIASDAPGNSIIIGLKRTDITDSKRMNVIGAVGSNMGWNDDIGGGQGAEISIN